MADLGSFDTKVFRKVQDARSFWPSRLAFGTEIVTREGRPIARIEDLFAPGEGVVDRPILLSQQAKLPCRIVLRRVPQEVAHRRRQKLIATARDKGGRPPSQERLAWCDGSHQVQAARLVGLVLGLAPAHLLLVGEAQEPPQGV